MSFLSRFEIMLNIIEDNLDNDSKIKKKIGDTFGFSERVVPALFEFITNIDFKDYVLLRKLAVAMDEAKNNKDMKLEDIAYKYGYEYESSFSSACNTKYHIRPSEYRDNTRKVDTQKPLTINSIFDNTQKASSFFNQQGELMIFNAAKGENLETIRGILEYCEEYGLTKELVLAAYELQEEKRLEQLAKTCRVLSILPYSKPLTTEQLRYIANINCEIDSPEVFLAEIEQSGLTKGQIDMDYFEAITEYSFPDCQYVLVDSLPYSQYIGYVKKLVLDTIEDKDDNNHIILCCRSIGRCFDRKKILNPNEHILSLMRFLIENVYYGISHYDQLEFLYTEITRSSDKEDSRQYCNLLWNDFLQWGSLISYEKYQEMSMKVAAYGYESLSKFQKSQRNNDMSVIDLVKSIEDELWDEKLARSFGINNLDILYYAKLLSNSRVSITNACNVLGKLSKYMAINTPFVLFSVFISLNKGITLVEAAKYIEDSEEFENCNYKDCGLAFLHINLSWARVSKKENFKIVPYHFFDKITALVSKSKRIELEPTKLYITFFVILSYMNGQVENIDEYFESVINMFNKVEYDKYMPIGYESEPERFYVMFNKQFKDANIDSISKREINALWKAANYNLTYECIMNMAESTGGKEDEYI